MTDKAIKWVRQQKALMADKPFFMYFAPGATHAPHQVPKEWIEKYKGKFDQGWDKLREETFARQKELGVIPADAVLTKRHDEIPAWESMPEAMKPILVRQMEVYAGFLEHIDHYVGRLVDALEDLGILDDTLDLLHHWRQRRVGGRNAERLFQRDDDAQRHDRHRDARFPHEQDRQVRRPGSLQPLRRGWAHAMCTPYQWTKQVASHWGGTRNGTIVHWPNGIKAKGELRSQFHHVIDIAPTILEVAGLPEPTIVNSVQQAPLEGGSMIYSFDDGKAADRHELQYFEMFCNRGIYHKGWTAVTRHSVPWVMAPLPPFEDDTWELYGPDDWTRASTLPKRIRKSSRNCSGPS